MVYTIVFKKRFETKLEKLLLYLENEFGLLIAQKFARLLQVKFDTLQRYPLTGVRSTSISNVRSILAGKHSRIYYRIEGDQIVVLNMYDTRMNPHQNKLK